VWSVQTVSLGVRTGRVQSFRLYMFGVRTELESCRSDDPCHTSEQALASSSGRLLYIVRMRVTCLLLSEAANVQTSSLHRPDENSTAAIYWPDRRILSTLPHTIPLFGCFRVKSMSFLIFLLLLLVLLLIISHSRYVFNRFLCNFNC
jgi:hypothetical protein